MLRCRWLAANPPLRTSLLTHHWLVGDQGIPNAGHCLSNAQVGVKLVTVEPGKKLGQKWSQLLSSLGSYHIETKSCSLKLQQKSICWNNLHDHSVTAPGHTTVCGKTDQQFRLKPNQKDLNGTRISSSSVLQYHSDIKHTITISRQHNTSKVPSL